MGEHAGMLLWPMLCHLLKAELEGLNGCFLYLQALQVGFKITLLTRSLQAAVDATKATAGGLAETAATSERACWHDAHSMMLAGRCTRLPCPLLCTAPQCYTWGWTMLLCWLALLQWPRASSRPPSTRLPM